MEFKIWRNESISFFEDQSTNDMETEKIQNTRIFNKLFKKNLQERIEEKNWLSCTATTKPSNETLNNLAIADLDSYEEKKVEEIIIIRSRTRWHEHGEEKYIPNPFFKI